METRLEKSDFHKIDFGVSYEKSKFSSEKSKFSSEKSKFSDEKSKFSYEKIKIFKFLGGFAPQTPLKKIFFHKKKTNQIILLYIKHKKKEKYFDLR